jgi:hypothetical protein
MPPRFRFREGCRPPTRKLSHHWSAMSRSPEAVSQTLILCEDNPTVFRDGPEPNTILFIPLEMFVVDFDREVSLFQCKP